MLYELKSIIIFLFAKCFCYSLGIKVDQTRFSSCNFLNIASTGNFNKWFIPSTVMIRIVEIFNDIQ